MKTIPSPPTHRRIAVRAAWTRLLCAFCLVAWALGSSIWVEAQEASTRAAPPSSINDRDALLLEGLQRKPTDAAANQPPSKAGEDVGTSSRMTVFELVQRMQQVTLHLKTKTVTDETLTWERSILTGISHMMEVSAATPASNAAGNNPNPAPGNTPDSQSDPGTNKLSSGTGDQSQSPLPSAGLTGTTDAAAADALGAVWGELPAEVRARIGGDRTSEIPPEYRDRVRDYFRQLAARRKHKP